VQEKQNDGGILRIEARIDDIFLAMKNQKPACDYMYVYTDSGQAQFYKTKLISHNFNRGNGTAYATYQIMIDTYHLPNKIIVQAGFAFDSNTQSIISKSQTNYLKKQGSQLIVAGTIYLDEISEGITASPVYKNQPLTGGSFTGNHDNPLIKVFLGAEAFDKSKVLIRNGSYTAPLNHFNRTTGFLSDTLGFELEFFDKGMTIIAANSPNPTPEVVLFYRGIASARFLPHNASQIIEQVRAGAAATLSINRATAAVSGITGSSGNSITDFNINRNAGRGFMIREESFVLPQNSKILADRTRHYFAVLDYLDQDINDSSAIADITLYKLEGARLNPYAYARGKGAACFEDGTLLVYKEKSIELVNNQREKNFYIELDICPGERNEAILLNGSIALVTLTGTMTSIYSINAEGEIFNRIQKEYQTSSIGLINFNTSISVIAGAADTTSYTPFSQGIGPFDAWITHPMVMSFVRGEDRPVYEGGRLVSTNWSIPQSRHIEPFATSNVVAMSNTRIMDDFMLQNTSLVVRVHPISNVSLNLLESFLDFGGVKRVYNNDGQALVFTNSGHVFIYGFELVSLRINSPQIAQSEMITVVRTGLSRRAGAIRIEFSQKEVTEYGNNDRHTVNSA